LNQIARVTYSEKDFTIETPFDAAFVAELKSVLKTRKWDPAKKVWKVDMKERVQALALIKRYFKVAEDQAPAEPACLPLEIKASTLEIPAQWLTDAKLEIYTDGACHGNPGPGGYGIIFKGNGQPIARSGGYKLTTNNRMEIMAAIAALETLSTPAGAVIYSDSQYLVDAMTKGWAKRWKANGWKRNNKDKALNPDLWDRLLKLCERHQIEFRWVRGHNSQTENEWCDHLAEAAAREPNLPEDSGYIPDSGVFGD
jgi:ribonuclease HI